MGTTSQVHSTKIFPLSSLLLYGKHNSLRLFKKHSTVDATRKENYGEFRKAMVLEREIS